MLTSPAGPRRGGPDVNLSDFILCCVLDVDNSDSQTS